MEVKSGFSVIELTVVIGLLSMLALAMSAIMLTTIVSSNRVRTLTKIKQAGDHSLNQLQSLVRNARGIVLCDSVNSTGTIINPDGRETTILLENDTDGTPRIASNSGIYLTPGDLKVANFGFLCSPSDDNPRLVTVSFDLSTLSVSTNPKENPLLHFTATSELRND